MDTPRPTPSHSTISHKLVTRARLIGCWKLKEHGVVDPKGQFHASPADLTGRLTYEMSGAMALVLAGETAEIYAGRYSVEGARVLHRFELTPPRGSTGGAETLPPVPAQAELSGRELVVTSPSGLGGHWRSVWERTQVA